MSPTKSQIENMLQAMAEVSDEVLAGLNHDELHITEDNQSDWEAALAHLSKSFDLVKDLKRHTSPAEPMEHDDATQPVWARQVEAAF